MRMFGPLVALLFPVAHFTRSSYILRQATTSPEVLSRLGAMESISSMKMIAGEFFLVVCNVKGSVQGC